MFTRIKAQRQQSMATLKAFSVMFARSQGQKQRSAVIIREFSPMFARSQVWRQRSITDPQPSVSTQTDKQEQPEVSFDKLEGDLVDIDPPDTIRVTAMNATKNSQDRSKIEYSRLSSLEDCLEYFPNMSDEDKMDLRAFTKTRASWLKGIQRVGEYERIRATFPNLDNDIWLYRLFFLLEKGHDIIGSTINALKKQFPENEEVDINPYQYKIMPVAAFHYKFEDKLGAVQSLYEYINNLYIQRKPNSNKYSPLATMFQSSGSGKSRLAIELHTKNVYVVYCTFISSYSSGYPKQSKIASELLDNDNPYFPAYIAACVELVADCYVSGVSPADFCKHITSKVIDAKLSDEIQKRMKKTPQNPQEYRDNIARFSELLQMNQTDAAKKYQIDSKTIRGIFNVDTFSVHKFQDENLRIVFVFDEVSQLKEPEKDGYDYTHWLCRALDEIPSDSGIFGIMIDTSSALSSFMGQYVLSPSTKNLEYISKYPRPKNILGTTVNDIDSVNFNNLFDSTRLYSIGRPMWSAFLRNTNPKNLVDFATAKLTLSANLEMFMEESSLSELRPLVAFGPLLSPNFSNSGLSERVVSKNMSTVYYVSEDKRMLVTGYPPEPILAEAAASIIMDSRYRFKLIKELTHAVSVGNVSQGERGELAAKLLLLLAKFKTKNNTGYTVRDSKTMDSVYFEDFIETLAGKEAKLYVQQKTKLAKALVFFNSFKKWRNTPNISGLMNCFKGCIAVDCKDNQAGIDSIIPLLCQNKEGKYELKLENMTGCLISFKNHLNKFTPEEIFTYAVEKTTLEATGIKDISSEHMSLLISFGEVFSIKKTSFDPSGEYINYLDQKIKKTTSRENTRLEEALTEAKNSAFAHPSWVIAGFKDNYKFLGDSEKKIIKELCEVSFKLEKILSEDENIFFNNMCMYPEETDQ